jgi:glucan-binding repeat-containing protein
MKKVFNFLFCLACAVLLFATMMFAHPNDVYPKISPSYYDRYPHYASNYPGAPGALQYNNVPECWQSYHGRYNYRYITAPSPQIVYDNNGFIPIGNFIERAGKNYFCYLSGVFARNTWLNTKGKWYYFNPDSEMVIGWCVINGQVYYFNSDGSMATGTTIIDGVTHYFDALGILVF